MSAYRDQSQGVAFVFTNLYKLYVKSKNAEGKGIIPEPIDVMAFKPRGKGEAARPIHKTTLNAKELEKATETKESEDSLTNLKNKLSELENTHQKLQFMIKELSSVIDSKKKKS